MIKVAPEGKPFIVGAFVILGLLLIFTHWWALLWLPIAIWVVAFFRDPPRDGERGPDVAIAPADGLLVDVREIDEPSFIGGKALRVSEVLVEGPLGADRLVRPVGLDLAVVDPARDPPIPVRVASEMGLKRGEAPAEQVRAGCNAEALHLRCRLWADPMEA